VSEAERFLFPSANTPWVYALAENLAQQGNPSYAVTVYDWRTKRIFNPKWPARPCPEALKRAAWTYPPGFMGRLEPLFRPFLKARWGSALRELGSAAPWVVNPYPWLVESFRGLAPGRMIYFNLDDYQLYRPERTELVTREEDELVGRSELILCLAQTQVAAFQRRYPAKADRVRHLPLAAVEPFLNPAPEGGFRENTVGYIGNLIDRVDWKLVLAVAKRMPETEFVFVGYSNVSSGGGQHPGWELVRDEVLKLPNVRQIPTVPQSEVGKHYWSFAVTWIPYATDHIFNAASCPTKIMDGMASGRPVLSTDIPECRLYPEWITIFHSVDEAVELIRRELASVRGPDAAGKSKRQVQYVASSHTYKERARRVQEWVAELVR
jgi:glycosyltransferase involved in cell wall biosynthesis